MEFTYNGKKHTFKSACVFNNTDIDCLISANDKMINMLNISTSISLEKDKTYIIYSATHSGETEIVVLLTVNLVGD